MPRLFASRDLNLYRRLMLQARRCWPHLGLIGLLTFVYTPLKLMVPVPLAIAVDSVIGDKQLPGWLQSVTPDAWQSDSAEFGVDKWREDPK